MILLQIPRQPADLFNKENHQFLDHPIMKTFSEVQLTIVEDNDLTRLANEIVETGQFRFEKDKKFDFTTDKLVRKGVLEENAGAFALKNYDELNYLVVNHYKQKFNLQLSSRNIEDVFELVEKITEDLSRRQFQRGKDEFIKGITRFLFYSAIKDFGIEYNNFLLTLKKDAPNTKLYSFLDAYTSTVHLIKPSPNELVDQCKYLLAQVTEPDVTYNGNVANIFDGLKRYYTSNSPFGEQALAICLKEDDPILNNIKIALLSSSFHYGKTVGNEYVKILNDCANQIPAIYSLAAAQISNDKLALDILDLIEHFKACKDINRRFLVKPIYSVVNSSSTSEEIKILALDKLNECLKDNSVDGLAFILFELRYLKDINGRLEHFLIDVIKTRDLDDNCLHHIAALFLERTYIDTFFSFVQEHCIKYRLKFDSGIFSDVISHYRSSNSPSFDSHLINLITHDKGEIRFAGLKILHELTLHSEGFLFSVDILQLPAVVQYKLWAAISEDFREPKYTLPFLTPLFKSQYNVVRECFICKVELSAYTFGNCALVLLEEKLDLADPDYKTALERVRASYEQYSSMVDQKMKVKELNPVYIQSKLASRYYDLYRKNFSKNLDTDVSKKSFFLQHMQTILLAKGGGWKMENRNDISKLGKVSASFVMPRDYFINPEKFDWERRVGFLDNWEEFFKKWEAVISS